MPARKDFYDDRLMTFGEHLEILRVHLLKALIGLTLCVMGSLFVGDQVVAFIRRPIDAALVRQNALDQVAEDPDGFSFSTYLREQFLGTKAPDEPAVSSDTGAAPGIDSAGTIPLEMSAWEIASEFNRLDPEAYASPAEHLRRERITIQARSESFASLQSTLNRMDRPVALNVQEAFLTYIKVSCIAGLIIASPWVFYQIWLFVAAGLHPHERHYVNVYLPVSLALFLGGAAFCYYAVLPTVIDFLLGFNRQLELTPQIRISEWISFAVTMPVMFGLSFQLPLVMLFLVRIDVLSVGSFRAKRRMAILTIAILSMLLTPTPDPLSMLLMMVPLLLLYELGIHLCERATARSLRPTA
jgi:sec-independent protein translocase protein TatC